MSNDQRKQLPRRLKHRGRPQRLILILLLCPPLLVFAFWAVINLRLPAKEGHPLVTVSVENTLFTEPLDQNGDVDYRQILVDNLPKEIRNEDNAFYYLLSITEPSSRGFAEAMKHLPVEPAFEGEYLLTFEDWLAAEEIEWDNKFRWSLKIASNCPWSPARLPELGHWYEQHEKFLPVIERALECSGSYRLIPENAPLHDVPLTILVPRGVEQLLTIDAMRQLEEGNIEAAFQRVVSIIRLAEHFDKSWFSEHIRLRLACLPLLRQIVDCPTANAQTVQKVLSFVETLPEDMQVEEAVRDFQIPYALGNLLEMGRASVGVGTMKPSFQTSHVDEPPWDYSTRILELETVNWTRVFQQAKLAGDLALEYCESGEHRIYNDEAYSDFLRDKGIKLVDPLSISTMMGRVASPTSAEVEYFWAFGDLAKGNMLIAKRSEQVLICHRRMTLIACYLRLFQLEHGQLPDQLSELVPEFCSHLPKDPFGNPEFEYRPAAGNYQLISHDYNRVADPRGYQDLDKHGRNYLLGVWSTSNPPEIWIDNRPCDWKQFEAWFPPEDFVSN